MMSKKVSLILTTFNSAENLKETLHSIETQDYPNIEVNIKDGGSTDGTLAMIEEYAQNSRYTVHYKSCPDQGIYDAMNQGYDLSEGEIIAFFNDKFTCSDAVSRFVAAITEDVVGVHSDLVYANGEEVVRYWHMGEQKSLYRGWMPGHPTLYLKREIYEKYGLYDTSYRIAADYEFMVRFLKDKTNRLAYIPDTLISMYYGGTSTSGLSDYLDSLKEGHRALTSNHIHPAFVVDGIRTLRVLLQFVKRNA